MTQKQFDGLKPGDIVRGVREAKGMIVGAHYGDRVTVFRIEEMTNPAEWDLIYHRGKRVQ